MTKVRVIMPKTELLSVRIGPKLNAKLDRLAKRSGRSKSWHVTRILEDNVDQANAEVEAVLEAVESVSQGRAIPLDTAFAQLRAKMASTAKARRKAAE